jgi:hypothetical protein
MKFIILASLFVLSVVAEPEAQHFTSGFVQHHNGAVVPQDTESVKIAKAQHASAKNAEHMMNPHHVVYSNVEAKPLRHYLSMAKKVAVNQVQTPVQTYTVPVQTVNHVQRVQTPASTYPLNNFVVRPYTTGYTGYPYTTGFQAYTPYFNNFWNTPRVVKREADADAEAEAQFVSYYGNYQQYPYNFYSAYNQYPTTYKTYTNYVQTPASAVQIPQTYVQTPYTTYSPYMTPYVFGQNYYTSQYKNANPQQVVYSNVEAKPLRHYLNMAKNQKRVVREADSEADAQYVSAFPYNYNYYGNYQQYPYNFYSAYSQYPTTYNYNTFNGYYRRF